MAQNWNKSDVYAFVNDLVNQTMQGNANIKVTDTSSFVEAGALLSSIGYEKTLDAITQVFARDIFSIRKYVGKLDIIRRDEREWGAIIRKITPLYKELEASTDNNTDIATPLKNGESVDEFKINKPDVIETVFVGTKVIQKSITNFTRDQLNVAFSSEANFVAFLSMVMQAFENELEKDFETMRRATIINLIGGCYTIGGKMCVDLVAEFNTAFGTTYTRAQLLSTYFENFVKFVVAKINKDSDMLTEYSSIYHQNISGKKPIPRHTPKEFQRMVVYEPYMIDAKMNVYSSIFNPEMLKIGAYEKVNFWQDIEHGPAISVTPSYMDTDGKNKKGSKVDLDYVLGVLYDTEAIGWVNIFESTDTTHMNKAGLYYNTYYHGQVQSFVDSSENSIMYYLGEGGSPTPTPTEYTITNTLVQCTNSNDAESIEEGESYTGTLTASEGYTLGEITVTMGGVDISTIAVSESTITIAEVTGNIVIECTATETVEANNTKRTTKK